MSTEQVTKTDEPLTKTERDMLDTVECQHGHCPREVYEQATVDVVAGEITRRNNSNVRIAGVEDGISRPEIQKWCLDCAEEEFGINRSAGERKIRHTNKFITPSNIISAALGVFFTFLLMSILLV